MWEFVAAGAVAAACRRGWVWLQRWGVVADADEVRWSKTTGSLVEAEEGVGRRLISNLHGP